MRNTTNAVKLCKSGETACNITDKDAAGSSKFSVTMSKRHKCRRQ